MNDAVETINLETVRILHQIGVSRQIPNYFEEILSLFSTQCDGLLQDISKAIDDENHKGLKAAVHKLKGSAQSLGATSLSSHCHELQELAELKNIDYGLAQYISGRIQSSYEASLCLLKTKGVQDSLH